MPEAPTLDEAAAALAAANQADQGLDAHGQPVAAEPAPPAADPPQDAPPAESADQEPDLQALLEALPPEAREIVSRREKMMQADYTRKTQALAEERKAVESDMEFLASIRSDPYAALEFHTELTQALVDAGLTPAQAAAQATAQIDEATPPPSYEDDPDAALRADLEELKTWRQQQEAQGAERAQEAELQRVEGELTRQEMAIRQTNPSYADEDIDAIYEIAFAHGGNLVAAQERYEGLRNRFVTSYADKKAGHETVGEPVAGGASAVPMKFETVEEAHVAAQEKLRNILAEA